MVMWLVEKSVCIISEEFKNQQTLNNPQMNKHEKELENTTEA
jgi:hypothetical protein